MNPNSQKDKMCLSKRRYSSIDDVRKNAVRTDHDLYVYECPYCNGYHLTKHSKPIDPTLADRVLNIRL